jgi:DNA-binding transcriptional LysR family regulator
LFDRDTHHVTLTAAGTALLPIARGVLEQVDSIQWRLDETARPRRVTLLLGVPSGVHPDLRERLGILAERVSDRFEIKRWPGGTDRLVDAVCDGRLALTLARLPAGGDPALELLPVMSERLGAVVPRDRFAGRESVALTELAELAYVVSPAGMTNAYFRGLDQQLSELGIKKRIEINSATFDGISEMVSSGLAFSVSMLDPRSPVQNYRLDDVTVLPFSDFHPRLETGLIWRKDRAQGGDLEEVVAAAREVFAEPLHS